jgi:NAD(P)-dependent dehydrogenase (short-subunit alcohol dehydrogenase family)
MDRDLERAEETLAAIEGEGGQAFAIAGDVSREADCAAAVSATIARYGAVDVLVNNVGIMAIQAGQIHAMDEEAWDHVLAVNLKGAALMSKHALADMMPRGSGSIVNVSSTGALISTGSTPAYGASKAGLIRLTADMAVAYGRNGVRVNAIAPGHINTPMVAEFQTPQVREMRRVVAPLGVEGTAWDVGWTAVFLASDEARFITGTCIPVDGGLTQVTPMKAHGWIESEL